MSPRTHGERLAEREKDRRDMFARGALEGLLASGDGDFRTPEQVAEKAYKFADAMMAAREAKP